jgi:putative transposase
VPVNKTQLRLLHENYVGPRTYFITICTHNRIPYFTTVRKGEWLTAKLLLISAQYNFSLHAYCLMPDHLHFISEGHTEACDLIKFVNQFKQSTSYEFTHQNPKPLWQKRYYDHILRPEDVIENVAAYIWWNPVRKNLCTNPNLYKLSGSQTLLWMNHVSHPPNWQPPWKP